MPRAVADDWVLVHGDMVNLEYNVTLNRHPNVYTLAADDKDDASKLGIRVSREVHGKPRCHWLQSESSIDVKRGNSLYDWITDKIGDDPDAHDWGEDRIPFMGRKAQRRRLAPRTEVQNLVNRNSPSTTQKRLLPEVPPLKKLLWIGKDQTASTKKSKFAEIEGDENDEEEEEQEEEEKEEEEAEGEEEDDGMTMTETQIRDAEEYSEYLHQRWDRAFQIWGQLQLCLVYGNPMDEEMLAFYRKVLEDKKVPQVWRWTPSGLDG